MNKKFFIDLIMTKNCNFRCSYCYEEGNREKESISYDTMDNFFTFISNFKKSDFYLNNYESIVICFFGGEPTLELDKIEYVLKHFKDDDSIEFIIYTNGYNDKILDSIKKYDKELNKTRKIFTQISYDGKEIHDINRKSLNDKITTEKVRNTIFKFMDTDYAFSLKATIKPENFDLLYSAYLDFKELNSKYKKRKLTYFPTIDYSLNDDLNFFNNKKHLEENLTLILKDIIKEKDNIFSWMLDMSGSKLCSAGKDSLCIDLDGKIYKCHGCIFSDDKDSHYINNIIDDTCIDSIIKSKEDHINYEKSTKLECENCFSVYCLNCNASNYTFSKNKNYFDRWYDKTCRHILCEYYKIISKYSIALHNVVRKG